MTIVNKTHIVSQLPLHAWYDRMNGMDCSTAWVLANSSLCFAYNCSYLCVTFMTNPSLQYGSESLISWLAVVNQFLISFSPSSNFTDLSVSVSQLDGPPVESCNKESRGQPGELIASFITFYKIM